MQVNIHMKIFVLSFLLVTKDRRLCGTVQIFEEWYIKLSTRYIFNFLSAYYFTVTTIASNCPKRNFENKTHGIYWNSSKCFFSFFSGIIYKLCFRTNLFWKTSPEVEQHAARISLVSL